MSLCKCAMHQGFFEGKACDTFTQAVLYPDPLGHMENGGPWDGGALAV